jgi:hypothetical protein
MISDVFIDFFMPPKITADRDGGQAKERPSPNGVVSPAERLKLTRCHDTSNDGARQLKRFVRRLLLDWTMTMKSHYTFLISLLLISPVGLRGQFRPAKCEVQPLWVG